MLRKVAAVLGATGDIGRMIAESLSERGYNLLLCGNRGEFALDRIVTDHKELRFDISKPGEVKTAFENMENAFGKLDLVVICSGIAEKESLIIDKSDEEIEELVAVNLNGTIYANKYALSHMKKGGCIINMASFLGEQGCSCEAVYAASKGGVIALTKSLAKEYAAFGVRVNCVSPGYINTKMNNEFSETEKVELVSRTPLARLGEAKDVVNSVLFLAQNSYITGENITVSGGLII